MTNVVLEVQQGNEGEYRTFLIYRYTCRLVALFRQDNFLTGRDLHHRDFVRATVHLYRAYFLARTPSQVHRVCRRQCRGVHEWEAMGILDLCMRSMSQIWLLLTDGRSLFPLVRSALVTPSLCSMLLR